ncbi:LysM peptidoglycan-binding domain-containing protein [Alteromonas ponticola]|uniref:LysM peptidoglycan-binding domain-containing protein n=1 Tax=Alteromonas aquimaris TaxID=2998417 RepID=A0ABT3P9L2_9ALTE|nr:LysM peptidoglycan-binding domain-containing protein [Alteromonas aquimaris]MCW8109466.1 LysM peptidoglycan-binding domain-containing protein [Alteromonas aquimaris]
MLIAKKSSLRTSLIAALGLTTLVGCAGNGDNTDRYAAQCDANTINELKELNETLTEAIHKEVVIWEPAEAIVIQNELETAINNCDPNSSPALIAKAEKEVETYERKVKEAEQERLAKEREQKENERYLEMAKKEWNKVEEYDNLSDDHQEMKAEGKTALENDKGRESYNILTSLHNELRDRMEEYVVKEGDTLWDIAARNQTYGNPWQWPAIHDENREKIDDPNLIYPGQKLMIDKNAGPTQLTAKAKRNNLM